MASAEGESVPSGVGYGEGCPLDLQPTKGSGTLGERRESGAEPRPKTDFGVF